MRGHGLHGSHPRDDRVIRAGPRRTNRFPAQAGPRQTEFETVIERHDDFVLVRKTGEAAALAKKLDPRSADRGSSCSNRLIGWVARVPG